MPITTNFHTHTKYCDGKNSPGEIVLQALDLGMTRLGFSGHAYTPHDPSYAMSPETAAVYAGEIRGLQEKYGNRLEILCGLEMDYFSEQDMTRFDYSIGSVHYVFRRVAADGTAAGSATAGAPESNASDASATDTAVSAAADAPESVIFADGGWYVPVDESPEVLSWAVENLYGGDPYGLVDDFFRQEADVVRKTRCQIIGHFDIITKFQEKAPLFDEAHPRYVAAWQKALAALLPAGVPFEINTGAISRGYRTCPYPSLEILKAIHDGGGSIAFSNDSHEKSTLQFWFPEAADLARRAGFTTHVVLGKNGYEEVEI